MRMQIRRAYRSLISKEHPDKGGDPTRFAAIQQAYDILSNPQKRKEFDTTGKVVKTVEEEFVESFAGGMVDRLMFWLSTRQRTYKDIIFLSMVQ